MLVSIVITNYNKGQFLPFLFKILELTLKPNAEVIVIDDCSTQDFDFEVLNKCNFKVIYNKENKGIGYVRNQALKLVTGKYIVFIDGDDWVSMDYIDTILYLATLDYDIIHFPSMEYSSTAQVNNNFNSYYLWSNLYRMDFIKKNKISFPIVEIGEDYDFNQTLLTYNPRIYNYEHTPIYFYNLYSGCNISHGDAIWWIVR